MLIELGHYRTKKHLLHTCFNPIVISYRRKYIKTTKVSADIEATSIHYQISITIETKDQVRWR